MTPKDEIYSKDKGEFREIFRNRYVTSLSPGMICATIFQIIIGLVSLALFISAALLLLYFISGLNLLNFKSASEPLSAGDIIQALVVILIFGTASASYLGAVKQRLFSRLYMLAGRPLASVAGQPYFNHFEEFSGFKIGERYFDLRDDCRLTEADLEKLRQVEMGGEMRGWYIPSTGVLVYAEWRPA